MGLTPYEPPHDTCPEISTFRVSVFDGLVQLMWDGVADHEEWQLAWGLASSQPETFQVLDIHTTYRTLTNLDSNVLYAARVRGKYNNGPGYSEWSDTVQFMLEGYQGIESPVDRNTLIMPNPAHGDVSVVSSFQIISIEIYGMDGEVERATMFRLGNENRPFFNTQRDIYSTHTHSQGKHCQETNSGVVIPTNKTEGTHRCHRSCLLH